MIDSDCSGPLTIDGLAAITAIVVGNVQVSSGGTLRLSGQVEGTVTVKPGGSLIMLGKIKGAIINEGGAVDVFGFVGRIEDAGDTDTMLSMGAIVGGKRVPRVMPLRRFNF
ncbi:MAG: hypothetical protein M3Y22_10230 [Pseudomonadota bacterium]|nr:hypothetical protein [Pseudomonadota bacterium]